MKRFIFASIAALIATGATAEPLTDLISNKAYWKAMAWEKAEQSKIWKLSGWSLYEGKQRIGQTFTKERPAEIDGKNLRAKLIVAGAPKNLDDIILVIDENQKRVRSANRAPIPGEHRITEDAIEFKVKKEDHTVEYFIDRYTGAFKGKLRYLKGSGANMSGRCEKSKPGERKF